MLLSILSPALPALLERQLDRNLELHYRNGQERIILFMFWRRTLRVPCQRLHCLSSIYLSFRMLSPGMLRCVSLHWCQEWQFRMDPPISMELVISWLFLTTYKIWRRKESGRSCVSITRWRVREFLSTFSGGAEQVCLHRCLFERRIPLQLC